MHRTLNLSLFIKIIFIVAGVFVLAEAQAETYDVIKRFKLSEDRFRTFEMLNPMKHDFVTDITVLANKDVLDVIDDAKVIDGKGSESDQLAAAQVFLSKYDKTEQNVRASLKFGVPLPSFTALGASVKPNFRLNANVGVVLGIRSGTVSVTDTIDSLNISEELKAAVKACDFSGVTAAAEAASDKQVDIVVYARDTANGTGCITAAQATIIGTGKYFVKSANTTVPNIYGYAKAELRAGFTFDYVKGKHWFGQFALYGLARADTLSVVTENSIAGGADPVDFGDEYNTTTNAVTDFRFGYRNGRLRGWASIEELKLAGVSDNKEAGGELLYGNDPLLRLHGEYIYRLSGFSLKPFVGVHKRSGYGFDDGVYAGADMGLHVWGNRLGIRTRAMVDKEHFTLSPQLKLWLMHLDYMLKVPVSSDVDGVKPATIHSVNLRFFI
jgi:hypothetical protein